MRMSKAMKTIAKRGTAFLLSTLLCIGCISTNWFGTAPGSSDGITARMQALAAGVPAYEAGKTYYDAGTFTLTGSAADTGWNINGAASFLGADAVTLGATTDVNTSASDTMHGQGLGDTNKNLADYKAPVPANETYQYIAKGTTKAEANGDISISWEIKSWPATNGIADVDKPQTQDAVKALWDGTAYEDHAPIWASGAVNYYDWSSKGVYNKYDTTNANGRGMGASEFKYGSNMLVWDGGDNHNQGQGNNWGSKAWSVISTQPVKWSVDQTTWADKTTGNVTADAHTAVLSPTDADKTAGQITLSVYGPDNSGSVLHSSTLTENARVDGSDDVVGDFSIYGGSILNFIESLNKDNSTSAGSPGHHVDANGISSWTMINFSTGYVLDQLYSHKNSSANGSSAMEMLKAQAGPGMQVTKAIPTGNIGFSTENATLDLEADKNYGFRIYGVHSTVYAQPGKIWYGLADNGVGGWAYRHDQACYSPSFSETDNPWEPGKDRYKSITYDRGTSYVTKDSFVHAYYDDTGNVSSFIWLAGDEDPSADVFTNGIQKLSDIKTNLTHTRLYDGYDSMGYRTSTTPLDTGETDLVNTHLPMDIISNIYYDITDDSMRAYGTAEGTRTPDKVLLDITATTAADKDGSNLAHDNTVITDVMEYTGLVAGNTYTLSSKACPLEGTTVGNPVAEFSCKLTAKADVTSQEQVVAGDSTVGENGSIKVTFPGFNSAVGGYGEKKYVVIQTLTDDKDPTNTDTHGDATTATQIVTYNYPDPGIPTITTTATDAFGGTKFIHASTQSVIRDAVVWSGLSGGTYYVEGNLYRKDNGGASIPGLTPVKSADFTVTDSAQTGNLTMDFPLAALGDEGVANLKGLDIFVGQKLYRKLADGTSELVVDHVGDMSDAAQTVHVQDPTIQTDLVGATMNGTSITPGTNKTAMPGAITVIADRVNYGSLVPGEVYKVKTSIVYTDGDGAGNTLKASDGKESVFTHVFRANSSNYSAAVGLRFENMQDALYGRSVTAYNELIWMKGATDATGSTGTEVPVAEEKDLKNTRQTFTFEAKPQEDLHPSIDTLAEGKVGTAWTKGAVDCIEKAQIRDTVVYKDLTAGTAYTLTGTAYTKADGKLIAGVDPVVSTFTPDGKDGSVVMEFTLDTRNLDEKEIVIVERLTLADGSLVAEHHDMNDADQTVKVSKKPVVDSSPSIDTVAKTRSGGKSVDAEKDVHIYDTVSYFNMVAGREYTLTGEAYVADENSSKAIVTVEKKFTAEKTAGSYEMEFVFDASNLGGKDVVIFETLKWGDEIVTFHRDRTDKDQTIHVNTPVVETENPELDTVATDTRTGSHVLTLGKEAGIREVVSYKGLVKGREYVMEVSVLDKFSGQVVPTQNNMKTFVAEGSEGQLVFTLPIDTTAMAGKTLVVTDTLKYDGKAIKVHDNMDDADQTVYVGRISTVLTGPGGAKSVPVGNAVTVRDTIKFDGLQPGRNYGVTGYIIDVTGTPETAQPQTASAQSGAGTQQTAATSTAQPSATASPQPEESLNVGGGADVTPAPSSPESEASSMGETIVIDEGPKAASAQSIKLADGTTIEITGDLVATGTASFTPNASSGSIGVDFTVSTKGRSGHNLVCVEVITDNGTPVAVHADLADANQTVSVRTAVNIQTGASPFGMVMTIISVLMMLGFGIYTAVAVINRKKYE